MDQTHCFPSFLPDDHHFLFYVFRSADSDDIGNGIYIGTLGSDQLRLLSTEIAGNVVYTSDHLLYVRDCTLVAQPFDVMKLELTGSFACITQQEIDRERVFSASGFTVSNDGVIVFQSTLDSATRLIWFDPSGKELGPVSQNAYRDPSFSSDGRFLAVSSDDAHNGKYSIRVYDLERGVSLRLSEPSDTVGWPVWSSDDKQITYASTTGSVCNLVRVPADGSGSTPRGTTHNHGSSLLQLSIDCSSITAPVRGSAPPFRSVASTSLKHVPVAVESEWSVKQVQLDVGRLTTAHSTTLPSLIALWNQADVVEKDANRVEPVAPKGSRIFGVHRF